MTTDEEGAYSGNRLFLNILRNDAGERGLIPLTISESNRFVLTDELQSKFE
jgi:hypothetical protein